MPTELFHAVWNGERRKNFFMSFVQSLFLCSLHFAGFRLRGGRKKLFRDPQSSVSPRTAHSSYLIIIYLATKQQRNYIPNIEIFIARSRTWRNIAEREKTKPSFTSFSGGSARRVKKWMTRGRKSERKAEKDMHVWLKHLDVHVRYLDRKNTQHRRHHRENAFFSLNLDVLAQTHTCAARVER